MIKLLYNWLSKKFKRVEYIQVLSKLEREELATQWKRYGKLNRKLEKYVLVTALTRHVECKRDKEIIEKVVKMQNDLMEGFYNQRKKLTKKL